MISFKSFVEARESKEQKAQRRKAEKKKSDVPTEKKSKKSNKSSRKVQQSACQVRSSDDYKKLESGNSEYIFKYRGRWFIDTKHAIKRRYEDDRAGSLNDNQVVETLEKIGDYICGDLNKYSTPKEKIMFYYLKYDQGVVIATDEDTKKNHGENSNILDWIIITWLTRYKKYSSAKKQVFIKESNGKYLVESNGKTYEVDRVVEI